MIIRKKCKLENCDRLVRSKGLYKGQKRFDNVCSFHHSGTEPYYKYKIENSKCELCGWDEAPCDRHRLIPELGYVKENIKILCPNCHRKITLGILII